MATIALGGRNVGGALVFLLGAAVFLNYVDRGAMGIAAPLMKGELGLSEEAYGIAFSAFFWIYAPVQFFAGWLCDRFSVYRLMAAGILLWAGATFLMGFAGGFASLLVLRILLGVGESISFPGSSKIIARHVPPERRGMANAAVAAGIAIGPAVGTLAGGLILGALGWRAIFFAFGMATLLWLLPWRQAVQSLPKTGHHDAGARIPIGALLTKWPLWSMSIVHALGNYCFYFLLAWLPLYLTRARGFSIGEMTMLATLGYAVQAACALGYGRFSDWWTRSGRSEARVPPRDDGRQPIARRRRDFRPRLRPQRACHRPPSLPRGGRFGRAVAQHLRGRADVRRAARFGNLGRRPERDRQFVRHYRPDRDRDRRSARRL
jgi:MFS family permease